MGRRRDDHPEGDTLPRAGTRSTRRTFVGDERPDPDPRHRESGAPWPSGVSLHARTTEEMVRVICSLMLSRADGSTRIAWRGDKTSKALAKLWGVSWHWVRKLASEASRRIQFVTNPDEVREFLGLIAFETLSDVRNMHPMDRADAFQKITNAWRPILYPQKHEHSGPGGRPLGLAPEIAALNPSPEELEHFVMVLPEACEVPGCRIHAATRKLLEKENPDG